MTNTGEGETLEAAVKRVVREEGGAPPRGEEVHADQIVSRVVESDPAWKRADVMDALAGLQKRGVVYQPSTGDPLAVKLTTPPDDE